MKSVASHFPLVVGRYPEYGQAHYLPQPMVVKGLAEWIKTLRQTPLKQIVNSLSDGLNGRCCLGVYMDTLGANYQVELGCYLLDGQTYPTAKYLGLDTIPLMHERLQWILASANDKRYSFKAIADFLEEWCVDAGD